MNKFINIFTSLVLLVSQVCAQNVGIGTSTPAASAALDVSTPIEDF